MAKEIKGAEIFSAGSWNGLTFTTDDLDAITASFEALALGGRVPLKFGHNDEQPLTDGQPALGWVERVWRDGERLLADFTALPSAVYDAIKAQLYKFVSVELLQDAESNGASFPWVLSAVSLLGADRPAVSNLRELAALAMTNSALRWQSSRTFTRESVTQGAKRMAGENDNAAVLEQLRVANEQIARMTSESATIKAAHDKLVEDSKREKADALRAQVDAKFAAAINAKRLLPAARERYFKWHVPKDVDALLTLNLADVDAYIEEQKVNMSDNKPPVTATHKTDDEDGKTPDVVVMQRVRKFMASNGEKDYARATISVLREDPELAETYRSMPGSVYK